MKCLATECVIPLDGKDAASLLSDCCAVVRVQDQGAGPYLIITGRTFQFDPALGETEHSFVLDSIQQIDDFASHLKAILQGHLNDA